jgi:aminopeptidase N
LVAYVSQDTFLRGVQRYVKQRQYSNASLSDFLSDIEAGSGRDLKAWSKLWLETAGLNTLRPLATSQSDTIGSLAIRQEAPPEFPTIRPHRLAVGFYDRQSDGLHLRKRVELDVAEENTAVTDLVGERLADLVLVNDLDLTYAKIRLDERSLETATEHLSSLSDPLARAITWAALWDMLRDGEIPARRYLPLILKNIHGETDIGVVQDLLAQAASAVWVYGDPSNSDAAQKTLADHALRALDGAPAGSDFQLAWAHAFINAARSPEHLSVIRGMLDGIKVFTGLKVDTDLRWAIVNALAGVGHDDGLIDAELKRDPTDEGQRHAAAARAARPTAEAKEAVWAALMEDLTLPLATMRSMMGGFHRFDQRRVLEAYVARYFGTLANIWKERDIEIGLAFARMLFPTVVVGDETVRATDRYLEGTDVPGPVRRVLLEAKDSMQRAMRARAVDAAAS